MSVNTAYYDCSNIDESVIFPQRKMILNDGTETGLNALVSFIPNELLSGYINCDEYVSMEQIQRMITGVNSDGSIYIRLFVGI